MICTVVIFGDWSDRARKTSLGKEYGGTKGLNLLLERQFKVTGKMVKS